MKRSRSINLARMRKAFAIKPVALAVASLGLTACGDSEDAKVYANADDCNDQNPELSQACQATYEQAKADAVRIGPKYASERDCEYEFGTNQCHQVSRDGGSFFMPFMAGYMVSNLLSSGQYYAQPLFTSRSRRSNMYGHWYGGDGRYYGDIDLDMGYGNKRRYKTIRVPSDAFKPKPTVSRTIQRGGFGSSVRAKSSWGSSRKSGWGG